MADTKREDHDKARLPTAKWGAACSACATAKAKCIRSNPDPDSKCDRCDRLLKECTGQVHRPRKKRQAKPSRTAQIEERLNGLVNLLQASGELSSGRSTLGALSDAAAREQSAMANDTPSASSSTSYQPHSAPLTIPETYNSQSFLGCICRPDFRDAPAPVDSDDVLLDIYRTQMQPVFPFVTIAPSVTASELQSTSPFLMAAIRMVTSFRSLRSMRAQHYRLTAYLADHILIRSTRSLELLQGIIVMLGWHQYHCLMHAQLNSLIGLGTSLIADMSLNYPPGVREPAKLMIAKPDEPSRRTNEERRALLGMWFITSNMAITLNKIEPMKYTSYIQECMRYVDAEREFDTDAVLVSLVRVQRLTERVFDLNNKDKAVEDIPDIPSAPTSAYISAFHNEIERLRINLPPYLQNDAVFSTYLNTAMLRLYEPPAVDISFVKSITESLTAGPIGQGTPLDKMYQSSSALKNWFNNWESVPASDYYRFPMTVMSQLVYALTMLGRWAQLATPRTMYEGGTPMPSGEGTSSMSMYGEDSRMGVNSLTGTKSSQSASQGRRKSRCGIDIEKGLVAAVAALQSQLQSQPALTINIPEILSTLCTRCEQVNSQFQQSASDDEKMDNNVWTFSALKVRITRVKLEHWAELVAAAAEGPNKTPKVTRAQQWRGSYPQTGATGMAPGPEGFVSDAFAQDQTQIQNFLDNTPWQMNALDGIDPTVWFDGYLDWGTLVMNSVAPNMGMIEQQN